MEKHDFISAVSSGQALESLRNSDFDFYSAIFEVIDNSIQAEAENIWITVDFEKIKRSDHVSYLSVLDDGIGMDSSILHNCMSLGFSTRYNQRDGIGRFGVGMTLAAISQCEQIYAWSKIKASKEWIGTVLDLPKIHDGIFAGIPSPSKEWQPKDIKVTGQDYHALENGSLIVWEDFDRISDLPSKKEGTLSELEMRLGRVFRKWLMGESRDNSHKRQINIYLNGELVLFHDPLFSIKSNKHPDDPVSSVFTEQSFEFPIPDEVIEDGLSGGKSQSKIMIKMALLPEEFRKIRGKGGVGKEFAGRFLDKNEGVSILRAGREVHYDHLKYYSPKFKEPDRWWACEIEFDPVLDRLFTVKNIKLGVRIHKELQDLIKSKIEPTRSTFVEKIQEAWDKYSKEGSGGAEESPAEKAARKVLEKRRKPKAPLKSPDELKKEQEEIITRLAKDADEQYKAKLLERFKSCPYSITEAAWPGSVFFDEEPLGDNVVLIVNRKHSFYDSIFRPIQEMLVDDKKSDEAKLVKSGVELLLVSFVNTLKVFKTDEGERELTWEEVESALKQNWGEHLASFLKELKKDQKS